MPTSEEIDAFYNSLPLQLRRSITRAQRAVLNAGNIDGFRNSLSDEQFGHLSAEHERALDNLAAGAPSSPPAARGPAAATPAPAAPSAVTPAAPASAGARATPKAPAPVPGSRTTAPPPPDITGMPVKNLEEIQSKFGNLMELSPDAIKTLVGTEQGANVSSEVSATVKALENIARVSLDWVDKGEDPNDSTTGQAIDRLNKTEYFPALDRLVNKFPTYFTDAQEDFLRSFGGDDALRAADKIKTSSDRREIRTQQVILHEAVRSTGEAAFKKKYHITQLENPDRNVAEVEKKGPDTAKANPVPTREKPLVVAASGRLNAADLPNRTQQLPARKDPAQGKNPTV